MTRPPLPALRLFGLTAIAGAALVVACGPQGGLRPPPPGGSSSSSPERARRTYSPPLIEPDLDSAAAISVAARVVIDRLPPEERRRVLAPYVPFGPQRSQWTQRTGPGGVVEFVQENPPPPDEVDLLAVVKLLQQAHPGQPEAVLATLFVGPEPVGHVKAKLRPDEPLTLRTLRSRFTRSERKALRIAEEALPYATVYGLAWPVSRRWRVTSFFGPRWHPVNGRASNHRGVDLGVPIGTEIVAPGDGTVTRVLEGRANGKWIEVDHGGGVLTMYCHLSSQDVTRGQKVKLGDLLGRSGDTGRVTGPHLHYQLKFGGEFIDPLATRASPASAEGLLAVSPPAEASTPSQATAMH